MIFYRPFSGATTALLNGTNAEAFKEDIRKVLVQYMKEMVRSHNTTLAHRFREMGYPELIKLLEE